VSVEAITWALNLAPVPTDRTGRPSSPCRFVLGGLANHAGPDGTGAFPSVATLVHYTSLSERTVRTCLDRLEAEGIITPCDPDIIAARIKRADQRPQGWDLNMSLVRGEPGEAVPASKASARQALLTERLRRAHEGRLDGVQPLHPATSPVDNRVEQQLHPAAETGCNERTLAAFTGPSIDGVRSPHGSWPPGSQPASCPSRQVSACRGHRDAASATSAPGYSPSTATRGARARTASARRPAGRSAFTGPAPSALDLH
jgi:hypothetical protein